MTGFKLGIGIGLVLIAVAEMVGAKSGLGYLIWSAWETFSVEQMYVGLFMIALIIGFVLTLALNELERRSIIPWKARKALTGAAAQTTIVILPKSAGTALPGHASRLCSRQDRPACSALRGDSPTHSGSRCIGTVPKDVRSWVLVVGQGPGTLTRVRKPVVGVLCRCLARKNWSRWRLSQLHGPALGLT